MPTVDFSKFGPIEDVKMPRIKKLSGPALHRAWLHIPHVTVSEEADITDLEAYRQELDTAAKAEGYCVTLLSFVIKDADRKCIVEISKELASLTAQPRDGKLKGPNIQDATFTISLLGEIGGTGFTPIVNAPEVAILGLTRDKMGPVWDAASETFVPRLMQPLALSFDHRATDVALGARFNASLKHLLGDVRRLML